MTSEPLETDLQVQSLRAAALRVRDHAHAPYSGFRVGVALVDENGDTWLGCNVENASYPEGCCAETAAIAAMVAGGGTRIHGLAVLGGHDDIEPCSPCGGCRQRISEFADDTTRVYMIDPEGRMTARSIAELLPEGFRLPEAD